MVASRIPTSATRSSPYFSCIPSKPWFTSPIFPASSPKINVSGYLVKIASKLSRKIMRPSVSSFAFSEYSGKTFSTENTFNSVSENKLLLKFFCVFLVYEVIHCDNSSFPASFITNRNVFLAATRISFFKGDLLLLNSETNFKIVSLFLLVSATFCNKEISSFCSSIIGFKKALQAAFFPSNTSFLAS